MTPSPLVSALSAPIRQVQALVGPGWSGDPSADPAAVLGGVRDMLAGIAGDADRAWRAADAGWSGAGADAAAEFAASTAAAIDGAAERAGRLGSTADQAAAAVARARRRLQDLVDEFEAKAGALEPQLESPGMAKRLLTEARDALARAIAIVEELQAELDAHATAVAADGPAPPSTAPAGWSGGAPAAGGGAPSGGIPLGGAPSGGAPPGSGGGLAELASFTRPEGVETPDAATFGEGVAVRLPDGSVVMAPNPVAASAVRHALTQLGVPYQWGGTTPGVGLDCSGLTQWAYDQAGLDIPRLAQEQDIGTAVAAADLRPGDLAVWDGHVAMIVGDGTMIEAGDPVQLSPVRTTNLNQGFQGFWRPTA
ncbi:glycoside hydrolase [Mycolicibacterium duvalii]|uniref:Glycoside hydrolase n=1 Tax=Mycolicibacterium duvalii TaxID=39688 RepID=A0A7I7K3U3_9MYCO|nr:C40 family peptidase [Mycolicibacterium duvalii]MCV7370354.1 C40 family peptidase [Mycolicibacterium duvalii]PEG36525.1 glycoside hydrolase [Mycolicibacterium duvalii]BBX18121.1 glycoside hydrolase [Mycolicibacterium duvalii]